MIVSVILRKTLRMNICRIRNDYRDMATKISTPNSVRFLFLGWMKGDIYKRKVDMRDELLAIWMLLSA